MKKVQIKLGDDWTTFELQRLKKYTNDTNYKIPYGRIAYHNPDWGDTPSYRLRIKWFYARRDTEGFTISAYSGPDAAIEHYKSASFTDLVRYFGEDNVRRFRMEMNVEIKTIRKIVLGTKNKYAFVQDGDTINIIGPCGAKHTIQTNNPTIALVVNLLHDISQSNEPRDLARGFLSVCDELDLP